MILSRIATGFSSVTLLLPNAATAETTAEEAMATPRAFFAISDDQCERRGREILVCAQQNENDRYRLPFETIVAGDPGNEGVWAERERIQAEPSRCQGWEHVRVGCGSTGVSFGIGGPDSGFRLGGLRRAQP